jgi:hypothetical protein
MKPDALRRNAAFWERAKRELSMPPVTRKRRQRGPDTKPRETEEERRARLEAHAAEMRERNQRSIARRAAAIRAAETRRGK